MKIPIDYDKMTDNELLRLARKCIRELNDRSLEAYKVVKQ